MVVYVRVQGRQKFSTTGPPEADRGLKFEPDGDFGHKVWFSKGLQWY